MSKLEINASKSSLRISAEGAVALVIGWTVAVILIAMAIYYLAM